MADIRIAYLFLGDIRNGDLSAAGGLIVDLSAADLLITDKNE